MLVVRMKMACATSRAAQWIANGSLGANGLHAPVPVVVAPGRSERKGEKCRWKLVNGRECSPVLDPDF